MGGTDGNDGVYICSMAVFVTCCEEKANERDAHCEDVCLGAPGSV